MSTVVDRTWYEKVLQDPTKIAVGGKVTLAGAGCTQPGGNDGAFGTLRVGQATITQVPTSDNDTVTKGGAALCFGDSGGSAFYEEVGGQRWVMGVNSRGDIQSTSYLASVFTASAKNFYKAWAQTNNAKICGIDPAAVKCQGSTVDPTPPLPPQCKVALDLFTKCLYDIPRLAIAQPAQCRKAYADLFACEEAAELAQ